MKEMFHCFLCEFRCLSTTYLKWHCFEEHSARDKDTSRADYDWKGQLRAFQSPHKFTCYYCYCSAVFQDKTNLQLHIQRYHRVKNNFSCSNCKANFNSLVSLSNHVTSHMINKLFQCLKCQFKCRSLLMFKWHNVNVHQNDISDTKNKLEKHFLCSECKETFATETQLQQHTAQIHNEVNSKGFGDESSPSHRTQFHTEGSAILLTNDQMTKLHRCEYCQYESNYDHNLKRHLKVKHMSIQKNKAEFLCSQYQKPNTSANHQHRYRMSRRRHRCEYCTFETKFLHSLRRHLRSQHTKERPYECSICFKSYSEKYKLKEHVQSVHENRRYLCEFCNGEFRYSKMLKKHVLKFHH